MTETTQLERPKYRVPALEKGLDILEHLSDVSIPQSQAEIARALGRSTSEIFRMLDCLEQRGYLVRDEAARYRLSLKLFELAHTHSPVDQLLRVARDPLRELAQRLRESVHIGVLRDHQLFILTQEESPEPVRFSVEVGRKFPAIETASGRLLLAHLPAYDLAEFLARDPHTLALGPEGRKALEGKLEQARRERYVIEKSGITEGVQDISVLLGNPKIELVAALVVPRLLLRDYDSDGIALLPALQESAAEITRKLGLTP
ncbi:MAG: IclR family transcriptional regulator [Trueperaceae bacterium]|nr:MAG: IclR family transcriptional regulator [Trueperaceae bacterium]